MNPPRARDPHADPGYAALKAAVIARTGHQYYSDKDDLLFERLVRRFRSCGAADATAYFAWLSDPVTGPKEWAALEADVTIGETFFFRYAEQFAALRGTILPGLIADRGIARSLRVWSAGCSTGAEPYSVAILLHELLGDRLPDWHVSILGTDLSVEALAVARGAEYGRWALRTMPTEERLRYFRPTPGREGATREGGYALRPDFARMVRFERHNLLGLIEGKGSALGEFDLILCRNVLIYFDAATVNAIVRALGDRLRPGGWLLIGHAEPNPTFATFLNAINLPGTVAYRRPEDGAPVSPPVSVVPVQEITDLPPVALPTPILPEPVTAPEPVEWPDPPPPIVLPSVDAAAAPSDVSGIRAIADAGDTGRAWTALRAALSAAPSDPVLRLYEGLVARSLGREAEAERALRGAVYLDRDFIMAHYHLGMLMIALGRQNDARRALDNAVALAETLSPDTAVPESDGASAREVAQSARLSRAGIAGAAS